MGQLVDFGLDVHERAHQALGKVMAHAQAFSQEEIDREHEGFGYGSLRLQIHHVLGAERYWMSVLRGEVDARDDADAYPDLESLEDLRRELAEAARAQIVRYSDEDLLRPQELRDWRGDLVVYAPARVLMRTQTHLFHHLGQIAALARLLGRPIAGANFELA